MSLRRQDVISCNSSQLQKHVKCFIAIDPKILAKGDIKIGDTVKGNVFLTNRKVISCKGFYIRLLYTSRFSYKVVTVSYLIVNGETQDGHELNIKAIPKGTHRFPFSLTLPCDYSMVPIYPTTSDDHYNPQNYHLEVMIVFRSTSLSLYSIPITITEYLNIRRVPEYHVPIHHRIGANTSIWGTDILKILVTSPRSAYISGEELPFDLEISNGQNLGKIKKIVVSFVMRYYMDVNSQKPSLKNSKKYTEECIVSKTISKFSAVMHEKLQLPLGMKQIYFVCKRYELFSGLYSLEARSYFLKFLIEPAGMGKTIQDDIPIVIGTVDSSPVCSYQTLSLSPSSSTEDSEETDAISNNGSGSFVSLPSYSEIMEADTSNLRRADSITSLETLPPTFEEALQKSRHSVPLLHNLPLG